MALFLTFSVARKNFLVMFRKRTVAIFFLLLIALLAGCGNFAHVDWDYVIPYNYYGFLVIHYECPNGQPLVIQDGRIRIEFNDDGTLCIKDKFLASTGQIFIHNKDGQSITDSALTDDKNAYVFADGGVEGIGVYGIDYGTFEIFWVGIKKDVTREGEDDFLEKHFGVPKFKLNSTPTQSPTFRAR